MLKPKYGLVVCSVTRVVTLLGMAALPLASALAADASLAYITNGADHTVSVIRTTDNTVVATINLPASSPTRFPMGVAANRAGTRIYVTNTCDGEVLGLATCDIGDTGSVSVISTQTNKVIKTIPVGRTPVGIAVAKGPEDADEDGPGSRVYVVNACGGADCGTPDPGSVSVIRPGSNTVVGSPIPVGIAPIGIAVNASGTRAYVANLCADSACDGGSVSVIDTRTNTVTQTITLQAGALGTGIAVKPDGSRVYVSGFGGTVSVINTATNAVATPITTLGLAVGVAVKPDGSRLYVAAAGGVAVIDTTNDNLDIVATVDTDSAVAGVSVLPNGSRVYATNFVDVALPTGTLGNTVSVIDTATNAVTGSPIAVGSGPLSFGQFISSKAN